MSENTPPPNPLIENNYFYLSSDGTYYIVGVEGGYCNGKEIRDKFSGDIEIPSEYNGKPVKEIGYWSFANTALTSISIPDGVTVIDDNAFLNCSSLTSINIPDSIKSIGHYAFKQCIKLNYIDLNNVTCCGSKMLQMCDRDPLCNGDGFDDSTFIAPNSSLETVILGKQINHIGGYMLLGCDNLKSLVIPESVTAIEYAAMAYCINLKNVIIKCQKNSLTLSSRIFDNCPLLEKIYVIDGKGWDKSDTIAGKPIEILPAEPSVFAKIMSVKSMVFA